MGRHTRVLSERFFKGFAFEGPENIVWTPVPVHDIFERLDLAVES